jgi:hypothetical protein
VITYSVSALSVSGNSLLTAVNLPSTKAEPQAAIASASTPLALTASKTSALVAPSASVTVTVLEPYS